MKSKFTWIHYVYIIHSLINVPIYIKFLQWYHKLYTTINHQMNGNQCDHAVLNIINIIFYLYFKYYTDYLLSLSSCYIS